MVDIDDARLGFEHLEIRIGGSVCAAKENARRCIWAFRASNLRKLQIRGGVISLGVVQLATTSLFWALQKTRRIIAAGVRFRHDSTGAPRPPKQEHLANDARRVMHARGSLNVCPWEKTSVTIERLDL